MPPCMKMAAHALGIDPGLMAWGPANRSEWEWVEGRWEEVQERREWELCLVCRIN